MAKKITPIDTHAPNKRVWISLSLIMWIGSLFMKLLNRAKVKKLNKLPKPPYLLLSSHASMMDFYLAIIGTFPHQPYWVSTVEEFIYRYWLFRRMGVISKRKFTNDPKSAMLMLEVLQKRKKILVIYPEARYSLVGEEERIDNGLGRFVKMANVPVVYMSCHGDYLYQPQWSDRKIRKVRPIVGEMETIIEKYDVENLTAEEIQQKIVDAFKISEEEWMRKNNMRITYPNRAVGLHKLLYKCPHCGTEFEMSSETHFLKCNHCGATYDYLEDGSLKRVDGEIKFNWPSEWYKWEKECVKQEIIDGTYRFEDDVRVEKLIGAKVGFVPMEGKFHLTHTIKDGIIVKGDNFEFVRSSLQSYAIHIEYNYLGRGAFLDLATPDDTYFVYPLTKPDYITKVHFAVEHIYDYLKSDMKKE
jgi:1-acyl-sn-glycerol-3-phosphate acyltransferase